MNIKAAQILKEVYQAFGQGDYLKAQELASSAHELDFEDPDVLSCLKCGVYWRERQIKADTLEDPVARGDFYMKEYQGFLTRFVLRLDAGFEEGLFYIRQGVYTLSLEAFQTRMDTEGGRGDPEIRLRIGKVYKGLGDYQKALDLLEETLGQSRDNPDIMAELADCYEMTGQNRQAKVLFREAFFVNPQKIDLETLQSEMILKVRDNLKIKNYTRAQMLEWIPVYAELYGLFSVKRELRPVELGQLKQGIYALRNELADKKTDKDLLLPRLINRYFWLIDHYICVKEDRSRIEEVLLNIKVLDSSIYSQYIN
ncbi:MAG: hypothetical protein A2Z96_00500 [Spirochaetes bacterium GWB1_48_6]|nr:MAG: hypothetical protein A2Z96_00500 [Spirochaetes bacterium GWB1_48_6]